MTGARTGWVGAMSLAQLVSWGSLYYTFSLLMPEVERELGLPRVAVGGAFSAALLASGVAGVPVGRWIDRGHGRAVMAGGSLLAGAALLALSRIDGATGLYAAWIAIGAAMAATLYEPVFSIMIRRWPSDYRRAIIATTFLGGLASTVFIPLTAWLIGQLGWRGALGVLAALQFLVCLPIHVWLLRGAPRNVRPACKSGAAAPQDLRRVMGGAPFLLVGCFIVLFMAVTAALPAHLVSLLRERGLGESWAIAVPASIGVLQVCGRLLLYFFESRFDLHTANRVIPALIPLGLVLLVMAPMLGSGPAALGLVLLFVLFFGTGNGMLTIVKGTAIAQYVSRDHVASLNGALGVPLALARAAAPLALGLMWQPQTGYRNGLILMLVLCALAIAALWQAQRRVQSAGV